MPPTQILRLYAGNLLRFLPPMVVMFLWRPAAPNEFGLFALTMLTTPAMTRGAAESLGCYPGGESGKQVGLIVTVALTLLFGLGLIVLWGLTMDLDAMSASFVVLVATVYGFYRLWPSFASSVVDGWPDVDQQSLLELRHPPAQGARGDDGGSSDERATRPHSTITFANSLPSCADITLDSTSTLPVPDSI